jgi:hypothetical protein
LKRKPLPKWELDVFRLLLIQMFPNPERQFCAVPDVDEAAVAIDQRDGETHGGGQRLIQCIAAGNMPADLMDPVNIGFNVRLFRIHGGILP